MPDVQAAAACAEGAHHVSGPLRTTFPGFIVDTELETLFDIVFRKFGTGTLMEALQAQRGASPGDPQEPVPEWQPEPLAHCAAGVMQELPSRIATCRRTVKALAPLRKELQSPEREQLCTETWTLTGLGKGVAFVVQIDTEFAGLAPHLLFRFRYKATALDAVRVQVDAEAEVEWRQSWSSQHKVEQALVEDARRDFETLFLPAAAERLKAADDWASCDGEEEGVPPAGAIPLGTCQNLTENVLPMSEPPTMTINVANPSLAEESPEGPESGIQDEYAGDWNSALRSLVSNYELRIEILAARELQDPEYRLGDLTATFVRNHSRGSQTAPRLSNVYVHMHLGNRKVETQLAAVEDGGNSVTFDRERVLWVYSGEPEIRLQAYDKRGLQSIIRGDPMIGEGFLRLDPGLTDGLPRWEDVPLRRRDKDEACGFVTLRFQFLRAAGRRS